jgi:imidazoleglycerol-phosphate dehydratase
VKSDNTKHRKISFSRKTNETSIDITVDLDGFGNCKIDSGYKFLDHLVTIFSKYSIVDLVIDVESKDKIAHHLIEDLGIVLGQSLDKSLGERSRIHRFGYAIIPMDDSLSRTVIDLVKRRYSVINLNLVRDSIEDLIREDIEHFFRSLIENLNACVHINVEYGTDDHHKIESAIKSFAHAFRQAIEIDKRITGIPSTKGVL